MLGFHKWHATAPYACRPYKSEVVDFVNNLKYDSVIEVGCGLGEIVSRVNCSKCYGVDRDNDVINAAKILSNRNNNIKYVVGELSSIHTLFYDNESMDLLIMVNWPHGVKWRTLSSAVLAIVSKYGISSIIIDGIKVDKHDYANHYDESVFSEWGTVQSKIPLSDGVRYLYHISVQSTF